MAAKITFFSTFTAFFDEHVNQEDFKNGGFPCIKDYYDDLRENFKKMYGEKEQKLTTGLHALGRRNDFMLEADYCALLGKENTSHGYCKRTEWPPPFSWARYILRDSASPDHSLPYSFPQGVIVALVLVPVLAVIFIYIAIAVRRRYQEKKSGYVQQRSTYTEPDIDNPTA